MMEEPWEEEEILPIKCRHGRHVWSFPQKGEFTCYFDYTIDRGEAKRVTTLRRCHECDTRQGYLPGRGWVTPLAVLPSRMPSEWKIMVILKIFATLTLVSTILYFAGVL